MALAQQPKQAAGERALSVMGQEATWLAGSLALGSQSLVEVKAALQWLALAALRQLKPRQRCW